MSQPGISNAIFHLVTESDFQTRCNGNEYIPALFEQDGFIHCTAEPDTLLAVANDYFSDVEEPVLVLDIDLEQVKAKLKFEPPSPIAGGGGSHVLEGLLFPHIYGPLNLDAIIETRKLRRKQGRFFWPDSFCKSCRIQI
jgi:uncharacterized protein (DUF952 family)